MEQKTILITGVSTGIGKGMAKAFLDKGYTVFGSVRNENDADSLGTEFGSAFIPLLFDVTRPEQIRSAKQQVEKELNGKILTGLINNSGIAIAGPLMHQPIETVRQHFEVNTIGLLSVTQQFLPLLGARENHSGPKGKIINISSAGGKLAGPFIGAYHGSKFAVEGMSHTLRRELRLYGIEVIIVAPGSVNTPIWDKGVDTSKYKATIFYEAMERFMKSFIEAGKKGYSPEEVASKTLKIFEKKSPKTRYALVKGKLTNWTLPRLLPDRVLDGLMGRLFGLRQ